MPNDTQPPQYDVFLSHGSPDKPWVRTLHELLTAADVTAYLDEVAIEPGDNYVSKLSQGVGGTSILILVLSQGTVDRPWVELEWTAFLATHGPRSQVIPVLLDAVALPAFLRPFQAIRALDRDAAAVAARIIRAVGKRSTRSTPDPADRYTGQAMVFAVASIEGADELAVTPPDGATRKVTPPWRSDNAFGLALWDFEKLTRESAQDDAARARLVLAAQTVGAGLFELLFSDEALVATFEQATAAGPRAVVTLRSDDDVLLSLPWELLFHDPRFLVRDGILDIVRSTTGDVQFETQLTPPREPFTLVTNVSAPEGSGLSYEAESFRITHALTDHCTATQTELGTLADLVETVEREKPRGIHFSGHGVPGALAFENDEGFEDRVAIDQLVTALRRNGDGALPPFFFLASCHGNTPARPAEGQSGSASSAAQLHRAGVTEVVGYYGPIADELSTRAEEALYAVISAGDPTRLAVRKARAAMLRAFDGDGTHRPGRSPALEPSPARAGGAVDNVTHPFAWAQIVFYHRGSEHPLGTPASEDKLRRREAALKRTYRDLKDRAFLKSGFIGRRRELHQLRRRRRRGDRVFVLQGLGGLGKTTLAGQLLPTLADENNIVSIWCRRTEGESDPAEALVGQLLAHARGRSGPPFEQVVSQVDRVAGDAAAQRFAMFLQMLLAQQKEPLVVYLDNLESLLHGPDAVSVETAPDPDALGAWRSNSLQRIWQVLIELSDAAENLFVVASCRYRNADLASYVLAVSPLADGDLFRLMAWFPALRRLSTRARGRLASRLSGHPRAVEFLDDLVAATIRSWEETHGEWSPPPSSDAVAIGREWDHVVAKALPVVEKRIWSDLLLAAIWDRVLEERARRMLFRMTLLRRPWDDGLIPHLGEADEDAAVADSTAKVLAGTSLLEQIDLTVRTREKRVRLRHFTVHSSTSTFVRSRFGNADEFAVSSHRRLGTYLEDKVRMSPDLDVALEAGHHLFEAGEFDRAAQLLGWVSGQLQDWGRVRESIKLLLPFMHESVLRSMTRDRVGRLLATIGLGYADLGETRRAIQFQEQGLAIMREIGDRRGEGNALGNLGVAHGHLGESQRAITQQEQGLAIIRELGDRHSEGTALGNLGATYFELGETQLGLENHQKHLIIAREIGDRRGEGNALCNIGIVYTALGESRRAVEHHEQALVIMREIGDRLSESSVLGNLGIAYGDLGEHGRAIEYLERQLAIVRETGDRRGEGRAVGGLGVAYAVLGEIGRARAHLEHSLAIGRAISDPRLIDACEQILRQIDSGVAPPGRLG